MSALLEFAEKKGTHRCAPTAVVTTSFYDAITFI